MRIFLAIALAVACSLPMTARGAEFGLRVVPGGSRAMTRVVPHFDGARVDFGTVSNLGMVPSNGRRVTLPDGSANFVATVVLEVVPSGIDKRPEPRFLPHSRLPTRERASSSTKTVDLFAILDEPPADGGRVLVAPAGFDWSGPATAAELDATEVLLAVGLRPGDRVTYEIALHASPTAVGHRQARVRFVVR